MDIIEVAELSFFELDRLFTQSAKSLKRKLRKKRKQEKEGKVGEAADSGSEKSDDAQPRKSLRGSKVAHNFGGFTGVVDKVEKTVVCVGVPPGVDEKLLFNFFRRCGTVLDVRIVRNRHDVATGIVICEFEQDDAVNRACALPPPFNELLGMTLQIKRADLQLMKKDAAPKRMMTRQQFTQQVLSGLKAGGADASPSNMRKLHIKNLRPVVTEEDMRGIFKPFGEFDSFEMGDQECWITFRDHNDAQDAMSSMQGFQLVGQELQIAVLVVPAPAQPPPPSIPPPPVQENMDLKNDSDFGATGGQGSALENRLELMKKLMTSHQQGGIPTVVGNAAPSSGPIPPPPPGPPPPGAAANAAVPPTPKPGGPTARTLLLQNMFSPLSVNLEKEPRFYEEIREDTHDECMKFGKVLHVTVDPRGATGLIYILYENPSQRQAAEMALNGRWFEGKKILAMGIEDSIWQALAAQAQVQQVTASS